MLSTLEKGIDISHPVFYHGDYEDIICSGLLINKTEKATDTKNNQNF